MNRVLARLKLHWVRHLIAALQVAIGVAVVAAVFVDVIPLLRSSRAGGEVEVFSAIYGGDTPFSRSRSYVWTAEDVRFLESEVGSVMAATVYENRFPALIRVGGELLVTRGFSWVSPGFQEVVGLHLVAGRFFDETDLLSDEPSVAVISKDLAELLFPGKDAVGEVINIRSDAETARVSGGLWPGSISTEGAPGLDVRVIGVFEHPQGMPAHFGFFAQSVREEMLLPATGWHSRALAGLAAADPAADATGAGATGGAVPAQREYPELYFRAASGTSREVVAEIELLLGARLEAKGHAPLSAAGGDGSSLVVSPAVLGVDAMNQGQLANGLVLGALGIAALVVSGFSIFTTFLATVAERVRSIGLARALGATRLRIVREIVGEAVTLSGIGGLIGVALSFPVRQVVLRPLLFSLQPPGAVDFAITIAASLLLATGIGALAALYPGWTVARMSPAEAFYEE